MSSQNATPETQTVIKNLQHELVAIGSNATLNPSQRQNRRRALKKKIARLQNTQTTHTNQNTPTTVSPSSSSSSSLSSSSSSSSSTHVKHRSTSATHSITKSPTITPPSHPIASQKQNTGYVDIGINVTSRELRPKWREVMERASDAGVTSVILTGTSMKCVKESIGIANEWNKEVGTSTRMYCTVGVHPHDAKSFTNATVQQMEGFVTSNCVVAIGECGLDYNRNFSPKHQQLEAFEKQVALACKLKLPIFVHEREAHADLVGVLDKFKKLPPIVIHCFTGTEQEAKEYVDRGYYIGFTGTICKHQRGAPLRQLLPSIPLNRIMLETDAPWMSFVKGRRVSEPADVVLVAQKMAETLELDVETIRKATTGNATTFFNLDQK